MRIAWLSYGYVEYSIRHVNEMSAEHDVLLMVPDEVAVEHEELIDPAVWYQPFPRPRYRQPLRQCSTIRRILRWLHAFQPDVVHIQNGHPYFNLVLPFLKKYPIVMTIHDPRHHLGDRDSRFAPQQIMDFGFRHSDYLIVHGTDLKRVVTEEIGISADQVCVIPMIAYGGRDVDTPISDDGRTLLFFGRIWEYKGLDYLIRAEPRISEVVPDVKIVIAGKGEDFERYRKMMIHPERFEVHNDWISEDQRAEMFSSASVVVLPYVEATQSGVIPSAYIYEKPVIATRTGGLPDIVDHGVTGLLVEPRDSDAIADAAITLLSNCDMRRAMGKAGSNKLQRESCPAVIAKETLQVYCKSISSHRNSPKDSESKEKALLDPLLLADCMRARRSLCDYLRQHHSQDGALIGPDPGVRFNYRLWRFLKSYTRQLNWNDGLYYLQAQGYWISGLWRLSKEDGDVNAVEAIAATDHIVNRQRPDGAWDQANPEWAGRITTVEGVWASLGLMESYRRTQRSEYLASVLKWHDFLESQIGYQQIEDVTAVNYFASDMSAPVPNNSVLILRYLAVLSEVTEDGKYLEKCPGLLRFVRQAQTASGEVPYVYGDPNRQHFQCFQYQAFMSLDLLEYLRVTADSQAVQVIAKQLGFIRRGVSPEGFAYYQCDDVRRTVNYHTLVVATALSHAMDVGLPDCGTIVERALRYVLAQQRPDGSVSHSRGDYRVLQDQRSYPRYLAMMFYHLSCLVTPPDQRCTNLEAREAIA